MQFYFKMTSNDHRLLKKQLMLFCEFNDQEGQVYIQECTTILIYWQKPDRNRKPDGNSSLHLLNVFSSRLSGTPYPDHPTNNSSVHRNRPAWGLDCSFDYSLSRNWHSSVSDICPLAVLCMGWRTPATKSLLMERTQYQTRGLECGSQKWCSARCVWCFKNAWLE